jgi:hypothetical protein
LVRNGTALGIADRPEGKRGTLVDVLDGILEQERDVRDGVFRGHLLERLQGAAAHLGVGILQRFQDERLILPRGRRR